MRCGTRSAVAARRGHERSRSRGAVLVEFALVAPLLFLLIFGVIEFGWAFMQQLDVRHGAREGARLAAVNYNPNSRAASGSGPADQTTDIVAEICTRMDNSGSTTVALAKVTGSAVGNEITVTVTHRLDTLTGFLNFAIPNGTDLSSSVDIRLEQIANWAPGSRSC